MGSPKNIRIKIFCNWRKQTNCMIHYAGMRLKSSASALIISLTTRTIRTYLAYQCLICTTSETLNVTSVIAETSLKHNHDKLLLVNAESKNASVVRKLFGYIHIPQKWASEINIFNRSFLNPYLNYHRPCFFPETTINDKGKQQKIYLYKNMMTPYEKLKSLPDVGMYLKPEISFEVLDKYATKMSDNKAAEQLQKARHKLFDLIFKSDKTA